MVPKCLMVFVFTRGYGSLSSFFAVVVSGVRVSAASQNPTCCLTS